MKRWTIAATAALLAACSSNPTARLVVASAPARPSADVPYLWTLGNAPQAHKDLVATFGRLGLKPGEYLWTSSIPAEGETRVVIDRLTQMAYVYRDDKLIGATTVSTAR